MKRLLETAHKSTTFVIDEYMYEISPSCFIQATGNLYYNFTYFKGDNGLEADANFKGVVFDDCLILDRRLEKLDHILTKLYKLIFRKQPKFDLTLRQATQPERDKVRKYLRRRFDEGLFFNC